jgi:pyridoxal phosphate-dependent aminotransferase EpsN
MKRILLSIPHMSGTEQIYAGEAFRTNYVSTVGANLDLFEGAFSARLGLPCVALASGTAAIHLGLRALGVGPGDEVFCSTLTFAASVNPILYLGATPVLIDSERRSWNLDPDLLAAELKRRADRNRLPKAIVVVHLYGQCADMGTLMEAAARYAVPVLEDAAEALGAAYRGQAAGTFGEVAAFSFNGNKIITTSGGGMLAARDAALVAKARFWSTQAKDGSPHGAYEHSEIGYNYRLSNVLAGVGRGQLEVLDERVRQRRAVGSRYREAFGEMPGIEAMPEPGDRFSTRWLSCFLIDEARFGRSRDELVEGLKEEGIETRPVWKPMHLQRVFQQYEAVGGEVAEDLYRRGICLPSSSNLTEEDQESVIAGIRSAVPCA